MRQDLRCPLLTYVKVENVPEIVCALCVYTTILPIKGELDQLAEGLKLFQIFISYPKSWGNNEVIIYS